MKPLLSILVTVILILSFKIPGYAKEEDTTIYAPFKSGYIPDGNSITLKLKSGFDFLNQGSETLNWELALTGAVLSKEVYDFSSDPESSQKEPEVYMFPGASESGKDEPARSTIQPTLIDLGYTNTCYYYYENSVLYPSACFGYKYYEDQDGKLKNIFAIVVRGTQGGLTGADFKTDVFNGGFRTFEEATGNVKNDFVEFAEKVTGKTVKDLKADDNLFFITGHSLGGVVANRLSITDTIVDLAGNDNSKIYTYTFEAPHSCHNYLWMDPQGMSNAFNFKDVDDAVPNLPFWIGATRYGTDLEFSVGKGISGSLYEGFFAERFIGWYTISELYKDLFQSKVENLDNQIFMTLFPNAKGGSVINAPKVSNYGDSFGHHDMGLPLTYILQKGIEDKVWNSVDDVLASAEEVEAAAPTLPLKAENLTWLVEPTYEYDNVEPIWSPDLNYRDPIEYNVYEDGKKYLPTYTPYAEYYSVSNEDGYRVFYMPDHVDSGDKVAANSPEVFPGGIYFGSAWEDYSQPWNLLQVAASWGGAHLEYHSEDHTVYYEWAETAVVTGETKISDLSLHKPYAVAFQTQNTRYALYSPNGEPLTDFVYENMGTDSEGLIAVCKNGKWGYINESGEEVVEPQFAAVWTTKSYIDEFGKEVVGSQLGADDAIIAYPCTSDTIVVSLNGQMGVLYRDGTLLIDYGQFEDLAPAWNDQLWARVDGKWGLIDLAAAKRRAGLPESEN